MSLTPERQLKEWQAGRPQCPNTDSECCPDFSCCKAELLAPPDIRDAYIAATREERLGYLTLFLEAFAGAEGGDVYVAGLVDDEDEDDG